VQSDIRWMTLNDLGYFPPVNIAIESCYRILFTILKLDV